MLAAVYGHQPAVPEGANPQQDLSYWARECFKYCEVHPLPFGNNIGGSAYEHFDSIFSGNLGEMVEVLLWLLPLNFTKPDSESGQHQDGDHTQAQPEAGIQASGTLPSIKRYKPPAKSPTETST
jgi:hypothetical protein